MSASLDRASKLSMCLVAFLYTHTHCVLWFLLTADLERSTEYSVRVHAMTVNGTGPPTPWILVETFTHDLDGKTASLLAI